jgi:hypothetical protein
LIGGCALKLVTCPAPPTSADRIRRSLTGLLIVEPRACRAAQCERGAARLDLRRRTALPT